MHKEFLAYVSAVLFFVCVSAMLSAGGAGSFTDMTQEDFERGTTDEILIKNGKLSLALEEKALLKDPVDFVWDVAARGDAVYAATGNEGRILKISGDAVETFYKDEDPEIFSLAFDEKGFLYAGTGPSGKILKIDSEGKAHPLMQSSNTYIWDLAVSAKGNIFAAVGGDVGQVVKIAGDKISTLLTARKSHVLKIVVTDDETVFASSSDDGVIYRIDADGTPKILYDASESEIRALALSPDGDLYFGTSDVAPESPEAGRVRVITQMMGKRGGARQGLPPVVPPVQASAPQGPLAQTENAIYRINAAGEVVKVFSDKSMTILCALFGEDGLMFGTGDDGILFTLDENFDRARIAKSTNARVLCLAGAPGGEVYFGTGTGGQVVKLGPRILGEGAFKSRVFDAKFPARWGKMKWTAHASPATSVAVATRTGNVEEPDDTWSDWSQDSVDADGSAIESPAARFIQYRVLMKSADRRNSPVLDSVSLFYLTANQQPKVEGVSIDGEPPKGSGEKEQKPPKQKLPKGIKRISWKASDPDGDKLSYALYFKGAGERDWKLLEEDYDKTSYDWDTAAVPDGTYFLRVVAADSPSNPPDRVLSHYRESEPFIIDNTAPVFSNVTVSINADRQAAISAEVTDATSEIKSASFSINSQEWIELFPADDIFDSKSEKILAKTKPLESGEHTLVIRVRDASENTASGKQVVEVP